MICARVEQLLDGGVHGAHAECAAGLHGVLELVELALADQVGAAGVFTRISSAATRPLLSAFCSSCCETTPRSDGRQHRAHVRLLVGREHVDHAVDGLRRAVGVQRAHHQDAHLGRGHRDAHRLVVAQLADQDDVRILAQSRVQRGGEARGVHADLALADQAALALMHELDRILDGEDVPLHARVDVIDHRRERGRLARAGLAGHQDEPIVGAAHLPHRFRQLELHRASAPWTGWRGTPRPCRSAGASR